MANREDILPSRLVRTLRARLFRGALGSTLLATLLSGWTLLGITTLLVPIAPTTQSILMGVVLASSLAIGYLYAIRKTPPLPNVAQLFDQANALPDLLSTALDFEARGQGSAIETLAKRHIQQRLAVLHPFRFPQYGVARLIPWFAIPIFLLGLGNWLAFNTPPSRPAAPRALEVAQALEKLAETTEKLAEEKSQPQALEQLAEASRRIAKEIMQASRMQDVYVGLATLSEASKAAAAQTAPLDLLQREALKEALAETRAEDFDAEKSSPSGLPEAQTLEKMLAEAAQKRVPQDLARQLQATVMDAASLSQEQQQQLEQMLNQIAQDESSEDAMQRLGQLGDSTRPENQAANAFTNDLEALRDALQRGQSLESVGGALASLLDEAPDQFVLQDSAVGGTDSLGDGGQPGTEFDQGSGGDPLGDTLSPGIDPTVALRLGNSSPDAERLTTLFRRAATDEEARRKYEERLRAFGPIEAETTDRESLPPTRREWVRRYFEGIRPAR